METYKYLALGDSYTIGESVPQESSFPYQLYERLHNNGLNIEKPVIIARTGWTTDELQATINPDALAPPYDLVTLLIGVNNQYRGRESENYNIEYKELLEQAIELAGGESSNVIVISIPDWFPFVSEGEWGLPPSLKEFNIYLKHSIIFQENHDIFPSAPLLVSFENTVHANFAKVWTSLFWAKGSAGQAV